MNICQYCTTTSLLARHQNKHFRLHVWAPLLWGTRGYGATVYTAPANTSTQAVTTLVEERWTFQISPVPCGLWMSVRNTFLNVLCHAGPRLLPSCHNFVRTGCFLVMEMIPIPSLGLRLGICFFLYVQTNCNLQRRTCKLASSMYSWFCLL